MTTLSYCAVTFVVAFGAGFLWGGGLGWHSAMKRISRLLLYHADDLDETAERCAPGMRAEMSYQNAAFQLRLVERDLRTEDG